MHLLNQVIMLPKDAFMQREPCFNSYSASPKEQTFAKVLYGGYVSRIRVRLFPYTLNFYANDRAYAWRSFVSVYFVCVCVKLLTLISLVDDPTPCKTLGNCTLVGTSLSCGAHVFKGGRGASRCDKSNQLDSFYGRCQLGCPPGLKCFE